MLNISHNSITLKVHNDVKERFPIRICLQDGCISHIQHVILIQKKLWQIPWQHIITSLAAKGLIDNIGVVITVMIMLLCVRKID